MSNDAYDRKAVPTTYRGHRYDSKLEARMAKLLDQWEVGYRPHVSFKVHDRFGKERTYTVDFVFWTPQKFQNTGRWIYFLEVKGAFTNKDNWRMEALEYAQDWKGYVADTARIKQWEREGLKDDRTPGWKRGEVDYSKWHNVSS
jgi:hypothetical protein